MNESLGVAVAAQAEKVVQQRHLQEVARRRQAGVVAGTQAVHQALNKDK